jgi:hypothetical protein
MTEHKNASFFGNFVFSRRVEKEEAKRGKTRGSSEDGTILQELRRRRHSLSSFLPSSPSKLATLFSLTLFDYSLEFFLLFLSSFLFSLPLSHRARLSLARYYIF